MTTQNHANNAARSAGHASMEVLTAAEADAIVGGGLLGDAWDFLKKTYKCGTSWLKDTIDELRKRFSRPFPGPFKF